MARLFWNDFKGRHLPTLQEVRAQAESENLSFPNINNITEEWIRLSQIYQFVFSVFFLQKTGLDRLDRRIAEQEILPAQENAKSFFQKTDRTGMQFFYIRMMARVDRLCQEDKSVLSEAADLATEDSWADAFKIVENTWRCVMTFSPDSPDTIFEPKMTLHGDYQLRGSEIPLAVRSVADFNLDGSLKSEQKEKERMILFARLGEQIDSALSQDLGCRTKTTIEVFEV